MSKLVGNLSTPPRPVGHEHLPSEQPVENSITRRIGRAWHLLKKGKPETPAPAPTAVFAPAPFVPAFVLDERFQNLQPAPENDKNIFNLSVPEWDLKASESLSVFHDSSIAALEEPGSPPAQPQPMVELPADFWQDLPDIELPRGPVSVEPVAFARRYEHTRKADEPAANQR